MTPEQYDQWKDFAIRMARHGFPQYREVNRKKIEGFVRDFFWVRFDGDDHEIAKVESWDGEPAYVCDYAREFETEYINVSMRYPGDRINEFIETSKRDEFAATYRGWEGEDRDDFWRYRRKSIWGNLVSCCVRAGLDVVANPSAGVAGFTVGDLRRMYPEGLPGLVASAINPPITSETPDNLEVWL